MVWSSDWAGLRVNDRAGFKVSHLLAKWAPCGCSSVGRVPASQAGCREFESRRPLH